MNPIILDRSLYPGITRSGGGLKSHVRITHEDINQFPETSPITGDGVNVGRRWLPLLGTSELGLRTAQEQARLQRIAGLGASAALSSVLTLEGCWVSKEFQAGAMEHVDALWQLAESDTGHEVLDTPEEIEQIHICDDPGCLNPRHYNFTSKIEHRQQKAYPAYAHFKTDAESGIVIPDWYANTGEYLPPVEESIDKFLRLRATCPPYTDGAEAPLSASGISKIAIDPVTGCWLAQTYYLRPINDMRKFQYDGYARLGTGKGLQKRGFKSQQIMAHRLMAYYYGIHDTRKYSAEQGVGGGGDGRNEVNHRCGTRHCCNPEHLEMTTRAHNIEHSHKMRRERKLATAALAQSPLIT